ncbi:MAG: hypothetical protein LBE34_04290 [Flavobacteriaceae bacterium]|jgi:hypothetical protein|nr:hypothetical protein [Flavobacteriaceae bacterium]
MKKSVQIAMLLGIITLTMISCEKDDKQFDSAKEVKTNIEENGQDNNDWGNTPIKPPKKNNAITNTDEEDNNDWGNTPITPPKKPKSIKEEQENNDWGNTPITPPKKPKSIKEEHDNNDWGQTPITPPKK